MYRGARPSLACLVVIVLAVVLPRAAFAGERLLTPTEIDTCSNSSTDTAPQITRVQTCARAAVVGRGGGVGIALSSGRAGVLRAAASACGDAVAGSLGELCAGGDPMATITAMATTCATSLAALYAKALTGSGVWGTTATDVSGPVTRAGALEACGSACGASQGAAEALAQAAACGVATATGQCMAAAASVSAAGFSRAFVKGATDAWGRACSTSGFALSGGDTIAASAAAAVARAMAQVAANACASCASCRCRAPPLGAPDWASAAGNFSDAAAAIAGGRVGLARAVAHATTSFCASAGEREDARAAARGLLASHADVLAGALGAVRGYAYELGSGASNGTWACGGASMAADLQAVKDAAASVLADASGAVLASWCPPAAAKVADLSVLNEETIGRALRHAAERCSDTHGGGQTADVVLQALTGSEPLLERVADALSEARACGCTPGAACLWCSPAPALRGPVGPQLPPGGLPQRAEPAAAPPAPLPFGPQLPPELQRARQQRGSGGLATPTPAPAALVGREPLQQPGTAAATPAPRAVPFGPQLPPAKAPR